MADHCAIERAFRMRTLLTSINGFAEILADPLARLSAEKRLQYAEIILASGERLEECLAELETAAASAQQRR